MASRKYSAVVEIGGAVARSFKTVSNTVQGDFSEISNTIRGIKRQQSKLEEYDPRAVRAAGREYRDLKRDVAKLERQYKRTTKPTRAMKTELVKAQRAADKAGKKFNTQREHLKKLGRELTEAGVDTNNLAREQKRLASAMGNAQRKMKAMQGVANAGVGEALNRTGQSFRNLAVGAGVAVGGLTTAITMTNQATARNENLARALGVSGEAFSAWAGLAKDAGFEADHVGDLIEEMTNKLGESKGLEETTPVKESLEMLGLSFQDIINLSPEQQFRAIAKAIKQLDDQQAAVSAADILMGGEANKFFGYLRSRKEGVDDLLDQQRKLNLLTNEGREGARKYNEAVGHFTTAIGSAASEVSGLIGGALAPYIKDIAPRVSAWMKNHRDEIKGFAVGIGKALPKIGEFVFGLLSVIQTVGSAVGSIASMVGGFENLFWIVGGAMAVKTIGNLLTFGHAVYSAGAALAPVISTALPGLVAGIKAVGVAVMSNPIGIIIGAAVLAVYRLITAWDELKKAFSVGGVWGAVKTFFGFGDSDEEGSSPTHDEEPQNPRKSKPSFPDKRENPGETALARREGPPKAEMQNQFSSVRHESKRVDARQQTYHISIQAAEGQDPETIADIVLRKLNERRTDSSGLLYDGA